MKMREAMTAYFDQVNKGGGVNGRKIELITIDDGYETDRTLANTKSLIQEKKVFALMGYYGSTPTTEAMLIILPYRCFIINLETAFVQLKIPLRLV